MSYSPEQIFALNQEVANDPTVFNDLDHMFSTARTHLFLKYQPHLGFKTLMHEYQRAEAAKKHWHEYRQDLLYNTVFNPVVRAYYDRERFGLGNNPGGYEDWLHQKYPELEDIDRRVYRADYNFDQIYTMAKNTFRPNLTFREFRDFIGYMNMQKDKHPPIRGFSGGRL